MKILIATDAFYPQVSGVVTTIDNLYRELNCLGHETYFIQPNMFFNIPTPGYKEVPLSITISRNIQNIIEWFKPNAIHIHTEGPIGFNVSKVCQKMNLPYTTSYATNFAEMIKRKYSIPERLTWMFLENFHKKAKRTMVATEALEEYLNLRGIKTASYGKGVDITIFNPSHRVNVNQPKPIWLYVGRISVEKNLKDFLGLNLPGTKICVGKGPELNRYKKQYKDTIFLGEKLGKDLAKIYASSDVFVFPSKWDTFGLVMIEAAAAGTPVAAYPVTGPLQAIEHGVNGFLSNNLEEACHEALKLDRNLVASYTANKFNWRAVAKNFIDNLEKF